MPQPQRQQEYKSNSGVIRNTVLALLAIILATFAYFQNRTTEVLPIAEKIFKWDDFAYIDEDGKAKLKPERITEIQRKLKEYDEAEQYVLLAKIDGWYSCPHCEQGTFYLLKGEVAKYGITKKGGSGRYDRDYLYRMKLDYQVQFRGNYADCLKAELAQIAKYPLLHENLRRDPELRLARPPMNLQDY